MRFGVAKAVKFVVCVALAVLVFGFVTMRLWNWLMPMIFGLMSITFAQAIGLVVLGKILFGGIHRHGGGGRWRGRMGQRWEKMSPEEREKMRAGMRGRWGCGPRGGPGFGEAVGEQKAQ